MRKLLLMTLALIICFSLSVGAKTVIFEDDFDEGQLGDFPLYFNIFASSAENFEDEGDNGYFVGKWITGAYAIYNDEIEDYTITVDFKMPHGINPAVNYKRAAIMLRSSYESNDKSLEPDNGDPDNSSYLGASGIYFYCYGTTLEVGVHTKKNGGTTGPVNGTSEHAVKKEVPDSTKRLLGSYTVSYLIDLPEGKTFDDFLTVKVVDEKEKISFYAEDELICFLELSDIGDVTTVIGEGYFKEHEEGMPVFDEPSYQTVVLKDAEGNELIKVEEAVVSTVGYLGFASRGCGYMIDNLKIELNKDVTPEPTKEPTPTPDKTPAETEKSSTTSTPSKKDEGETKDGLQADALTYVLIALAVVILGGIVFVLFRKKK
ncbi:MAG: hypothetical protein ACOX3J_14280 [Clostridia bacterium]|jgi:hypothetical protein